MKTKEIFIKREHIYNDKTINFDWVMEAYWLHEPKQPKQFCKMHISKYSKSMIPSVPIQKLLSRGQITTRFAGDRSLEDVSVEDLANLQWAGLPSGSINVADLHQADVSSLHLFQLWFACIQFKN